MLSLRFDVYYNDLLKGIQFKILESNHFIIFIVQYINHREISFE